MISSRQQHLARQLLGGGSGGNLKTSKQQSLFIGNLVKSFSTTTATTTTTRLANNKPRLIPANQSIWQRPAINRLASANNVRLFSVGSSRLLSETKQPNSASSTTASTAYKTIQLTTPSKYVLSVELNKPKSKNAFGLDTGAEFVHLFQQIEMDPTVRCVLLSGVGPDFTSGVDLKSFMEVYAQLQQTEDVARRAKVLRSMVEQFQAPFKQMYSCSKPIICVAHGLCLGLGIELAACSDIRLICQDSRLAIREVLIGIAADVGSLQLLPKLAANKSLLNELLFTGRYLTAEEALTLGFVSRVCQTKAEAMDQAIKLAQTIASRSPVAVQGSKQNMRFSLDKPFLVGLDYNAVWNAAMMQGGDVVKAIEAILSRTEQVDYDDF